MRYEGATAELDRTLMALADPVRRRIVERLRAGDTRVTDVAAGFPISLNSVSKHIRLLERAGLVMRRVEGRQHFLSFRAEPLQSVQDWIAEQQAFWQGRLQAIDDLLAAEDAARTEADEGDRA
jgi:Predicted transcriptional regulators